MYKERIVYIANKGDNFFIETQHNITQIMDDVETTYPVRKKYAFFLPNERENILHKRKYQEIIATMDFHLLTDNPIRKYETCPAIIDNGHETFFLKCNVKRLPDRTAYDDAFKEENLHRPEISGLIEIPLFHPDHDTLRVMAKRGVPIKGYLRIGEKHRVYWDAIASIRKEWIPSLKEQQDAIIGTSADLSIIQIEFIIPTKPPTVIYKTTDFSGEPLTTYYFPTKE